MFRLAQIRNLNVDLNITNLFALVLVVIIMAAALFGSELSSYDPMQIILKERLIAPSTHHLFGTDELGRDLFSRVLAGAHISILSAMGVIAITVSLGILIGGFSGLVGGLVEAAVMRTMDVMLAIPGLVLALALAAALGPGLFNALLALVIVRLPFYVRLARGQTLTLRQRGFVEAATLYGASPLYMLRHHILPNLVSIMVVQGMMDVGGMILALGALGFIGLGAQAPMPEWGALMASGQPFFLDYWWVVAFPGFAIVLTALGFNLLGDMLRDWLDPGSKGH